MVAAKCLLRAIDAVSGWKSLSKLRDFQPATSSPFRVLHQPQGDKPKKHISYTHTYLLHTKLTLILYFSPVLSWRNVFYVYRLEEDVSPLKEGGTLRACSYKAKAEGWHQGLYPHTLQGVFYGFCSCPITLSQGIAWACWINGTSENPQSKLRDFQPTTPSLHLGFASITRR